MLKYVFIRLSLLWLTLIMLIGATLWIAPRLPSKGTLLLTHNVFLNQYDRFEFYDISRGLLYGFTPDLGENVISASLAPNGRYIAVMSVESGQYSLNIMSLAGQPITETTTAFNIQLGSWSPNSRYFSYSDIIPRIYIIDVISNNVMQITNRDIIADDISWSADSQQISFVNFTNDRLNSQIIIADTDGMNRRQLTSGDSLTYCPTWSPDGEILAYFERTETGNQLGYLNLDGTLNHDYPRSTWQSRNCPVWSVDGRYIVFMAFLTEEYTTDIVLLDVITGKIEAVSEVDPTTNIRWWR